jgi:hypothetical protein
MTNLSLLGTAAVLSLMFASSTPVQAATYDSSACPNSSMTSANAPASSVWLPRGCETSTKPWSAPVGHRQPQATDIPSSISFEQTLDEENARIDRVDHRRMPRLLNVAVISSDKNSTHRSPLLMT